MVTCTKKKAARLNELVLQLKRPRNEPWAALPGDVEVNPDNHDSGKLREDRPPQPSEVPVYKGIQLYLANNVREKDDYVNGMLCHVEWSDSSGALRVNRQATRHHFVDGHRAAMCFNSLFDRATRPLEVERVTVWFLLAVAYKALSQLERTPWRASSPRPFRASSGEVKAVGLAAKAISQALGA